MGIIHSGPRNPNWRGGRVVDPRGYVLIRVGKEHPLADCRGYAYEHRLIAFNEGRLKIGDDKEVHHADENKSNNVSSNLETVSIQEHRARHRKSGKQLRLPGEENTVVQCACGCSATFLKFDCSGRPRRYVSGHNLHGAKNG